VVTVLAAELFAAEGIVRLPHVLPTGAAAAMRDVVWRRIESQTAARRDEPSTWSGVELPSFKPIKKRSAFCALATSPELRETLDSIFAPHDWEVSGSGVQVLFTFPNALKWNLPEDLWHTDSNFHTTSETLMVKVFCCLDTVEVGGGGTLVISGSHRLARRYASRVEATMRVGNTLGWRRCLDQDEWTRGLIHRDDDAARAERFMNARHDSDGIELGIVEMIGQPGDAYVIDSHTYHCVAPNASSRPRMMLACVFRRRS
jgi:hypothetical protein